MFEDIRNKIMGNYQTLHAVAFPTMLVNYPGRVNYDPEGKTDPFVIFTISFNRSKQLHLGARDLRVTGSLQLQYMYRIGNGSKGSTAYSDFLLDKISLRTISGIVFKELTPYNAGMEGWEGTLNVVPFQTEYFNV